MIQLNNIWLSFGGQQIFKGLTWTVKPGKRIGLIGPNGAGKTTMLRLIAGRHTPDEGTLGMSGGMTVGYLEQDVQEIENDQTVYQEAVSAFDEVLALEAEEHEIADKLASDMDHESTEYLKLLSRLEQVHTQLAGKESHRIEDKTRSVLGGLGFTVEEQDRPLRTFSGGWRMRVTLAKMLLRRPDYLLLDEPTNHLDIESIDWLEKYLKSYPGTVVLVSHDRYFLDRMINTTADLAGGTVTEYAGNYEYYLVERQERRILQQSAYDNQQREIKEIERFISRFRAKATKAKQVQSRIKQLDRMIRLEPPVAESATIQFRFPEPERSGKIVLSLSKFSKSYPSLEGGTVDVFKDADPIEVERGDKIALVGRNGAGKSTLARILLGNEPFVGERTLGHKVTSTWFAQHQAESLNPKHTILDALQEDAKGQTETKIRSILGAFLFSGDDVFKYINVLSGGERSRVALAKTLLSPASLLILDEPTNHLDLRAKDVLIEALQQFGGTFIVVSHDRYFLDRIVNKVWHVEDGHIRQFLGGWTDYQWKMSGGGVQVPQKTSAKKAPTKPQHLLAKSEQNRPKAEGKPKSSKRKTKEQKRLEAEARNQKYRDDKASPAKQNASSNEWQKLSAGRLEKAFKKTERDIESAEEKKSTIETKLADPEFYQQADAFSEATSAFTAVEKELKKLYQQWEEIAMILEEKKA